MTIPRKIRVVPVLLLLCTSAAWAADRWQAVGPEGGEITSLASDPANPRILYAAAGAGGVYKSVDAGASWAPAFEGLRGTIRFLGIDPSRPATLYAASDLEVFRTVDGAAHWAVTPVHIGASQPINALLVTSAAVYANVAPESPTPSESGIFFKSTDRGASWTPVSTPGFVATALAADPAAPQVLYAGSHAGVFRSGDGASSWSAASGGLPVGAGVTALGVPAPGTVYAALDHGAKVFRSTDGGRRWQRASRGITSANLTAFAAGPTSSTLYVAADAGSSGTGSLFRTMDAGAHWRRTDSGLPAAVQALAFIPRSRALFAGSRFAGVFRSADGAGTWKLASHGLRAVAADAVIADPSRPAIVFAGTPAFALIKTMNGGATWRTPDATVSRPLAIDPEHPATVYAVGVDGKLRRSRNGGQSWQAAGPSVHGVTAAAFDPNDPETLYVVGFREIDRSVDGGETWTLDLTTTPCVSPVFLAITPISRVFNGSVSTCGASEIGLGIHTRISAGNWPEVSDGLPSHPTPYSLAADPQKPLTLYAGIGGITTIPEPAAVFGTYRTDDGETWTRIAGLGETTPATAFAFPPGEPGVIYAAVGFGLLMSTDDGDTWSVADAGLPRSTVTALSFGAGSPSTLYAATPGGLFKLVRATP